MMKAIKSWVERELISRPWFLLGIAGASMIYFTIQYLVSWYHYFQ